MKLVDYMLKEGLTTREALTRAVAGGYIKVNGVVVTDIEAELDDLVPGDRMTLESGPYSMSYPTPEEIKQR
jgi:16S rRNA U516 pseudouridylate synthase RsuA-like enzyme